MSRTVCAIDLTSPSVQVLVRRRSGEIEAADFPLPPEAIHDGKVLQPPAVQHYLARLMRVLKLRRAEVRLVLSDSACVTRFLAYPPMPPRDLERSLRLESVRELPMNPESAYLGWETVQTDGHHRVFLVGAWRDTVDSYLQAVEGIGRPSIVEPRSVALARAVGLADAVLADRTGDRLQVVVVEDQRVTFSTSRTVPEAVTESTPRLAAFIAGLIPKASGNRGSVPGRLVLLGELYGRGDVAAELARQPGTTKFEVMLDWQPVDPFGRFAAACQTATIGVLMRDGRRLVGAQHFPAVNLLLERNRIMRPAPAVRARFVIALAVAALMLAVVVGIQIGTLAGVK
jgi:hypothetical protein